MPPWGRPQGGRDVGRYSEGMEEVYKYQEVDSDDEKHGGVSLDSAFYRDSNGRQYFNPDELYFNDMDIRAWERRTADLDALAYGDDYGYLEDEGYYEDPAELAMAVSEYEDMIFQRVLDKIRMARATGDLDVQLTPEELEVYQAKMLGSRAPAARPQSQARHASAPTVPTGSSTAVASASSQIETLTSGNVATSASSHVGTSTSSQVGTSGSSSTRAKKSSRRSSIFGIRRSKDKEKERSSTRTRAPSISSEPVYAPINAYQSRRARDPHALPSPGTPPRPASRSASISSDRLVPLKATHPSDVRVPRQGPAPPRPSPPPAPDMPGAFPGSSNAYRTPTPPQPTRPASSSSRQSIQDYIDPRSASAASRSRSTSIQQQPQQTQQPKLISLPLAPTEPYQYQLAGQLAPSQTPTYTRRISSGPLDTAYTAMPRRVPVPGQRASGVSGSASDPNVAQRVEGSDGDDGVGSGGGVPVHAGASTEERGYKVASSRSGGGGGKSESRDGERKRKSKSSRKKY